MKAILLLAFIFCSCTHHHSKVKSERLLNSWNEGEAKSSILEYVTNVTNPKSPDFIPQPERIAVFDNDGTLWAEMPIVELVFTEEEAKKKNIPLPTSGKVSEKEALKLLAKTHTGTSTEDFSKEAEAFFIDGVHPKLHTPYSQTIYTPQVELIQYLTKNGFKVFICSGGTVDFMRVISDDYYGIPAERVIGSAFKYKYETSSNIVESIPKLDAFNDKEAKPVNIERVIGKRPVIAVGNVRNGGDIHMLRYSQSGKYKSLQLLVNHDDGKREFAYEEPDHISLRWARVNGWNVVSMKNDWKTIFPTKESL